MQNTPLTIEKQHLEPPVLQRNWMISPPGSPQEGWVQIEEDPPNSVTLHEDIQSALDRLAVQLESLEDEVEEEDSKDKSKAHVILDTTDLGGVQVIVEDVDAGADSDDNVGGKGIKASRTIASEVIGKTPRPPPVEEM
jgi:calcipressin-2